jgi:pullulanase
VRDAALGGSPFAPPGLQGFLTGLHVDTNPHTSSGKDPEGTLKAYMDLVKLGLAGNLKDFSIVAADGAEAKGRRVLFNGVPAAYCGQPTENVVYLGCHDNETLYDTVVLKANHGGSSRVCARIVQLALGLIATAQGVAFFHAGDDLLRSKSLDRDSYNSGDWFNKLLWDGRHNNFGVGLPPASKNAEHWPLKREMLQQQGLAATPNVIAETKAFMQAVLKLRYSSKLFRLPSGEAVMDQVRVQRKNCLTLQSVEWSCLSFTLDCSTQCTMHR